MTFQASPRFSNASLQLAGSISHHLDHSAQVCAHLPHLPFLCPLQPSHPFKALSFGHCIGHCIISGALPSSSAAPCRPAVSQQVPSHCPCPADGLASTAPAASADGYVFVCPRTPAASDFNSSPRSFSSSPWDYSSSSNPWDYSSIIQGYNSTTRGCSTKTQACSSCSSRWGYNSSTPGCSSERRARLA